MIASAVFLGVMGLSLGFLQEEVDSLLGYGGGAFPAMIMEAGSGLFLGFALLNWMARGNPIGGIYSRPVAAGNFIHFMVGSIVMAKYWLGGAETALLVLALFYLFFAAGFGYLLFGRGKSCA